MSSFAATLRTFGQHLRDPHHTARPSGLPARPMAVYGELLFNNLSGFVDACFPLCRQLLGEQRWLRLERRFWRDWPCQSPWFREIPQEFLLFLQQHGPQCRLPQWFAELAHYEWAEMAVDLMDTPTPAYGQEGDLLADTIVVNPALMNLAYHWPVHRIGPAYRPRRQQITYLAVYRDQQEQVRFTQLTPASARLLALLSQAPQTGQQAIQQLAQELQHPVPEQLLAFGKQELLALQRAGVVFLGG